MLVKKPEIAHYFLVAGFDPNVLIGGDWTALHLAAFLGVTDHVEILIFFKAKVDATDKYGVYYSNVRNSGHVCHSGPP
jgi:hypothetical protein